MASRDVLVCALAGLALMLSGCPQSCDPARRAGSPEVFIDGRFAEWVDGARLRADGHDLFVRFTVPEPISLQAAPYSLALLLDTDGDAVTGSGLDYVDGETDVGAELAIVFSPPGGRPRPGGGSGEGVAALLLPTDEEDSKAQGFGHEGLDLVFAPTHEATEFELRISRRLSEQPLLSAAFESGRVSAHLFGVGKDTKLLWAEALGSIPLPPLAAVPHRLDAAWPARSAEDVRVVSWNVLFATPMRNPEPFARILRALDPDVVLVQEWEKATADDLRTWFDTHVSPGWHALDSPGWGVGVVARGELRRLGPERIERPVDAPADSFRPDRALRLAAAVVETRLGPVAAASLHLKCCGSPGGSQDRARIAEVSVIRGALADALGDLRDDAPVVRIFGGDLNLVGSAHPLNMLRAGLAADGGDLAVAKTDVLGDRALYTWRGRGSRFGAGRLDFLAYAGAELSRAFAVDTARLQDDVLAEAGLERADSAASDHLALVLDLRPFRSSSVTGAE